MQIQKQIIQFSKPLEHFLKYQFSNNTRINMFQNAKKLKIQKIEKQKEQEEKIYYPIQHPKNLESNDNKIFSYQKPARYLSAPQEVQFESYLPSEGKLKQFDNPENSKYLEIAIVGAPNSGKSSLFNQIIGQKIAAESNKKNTTYDSLLGYYSNFENNTQIALHDTPGITKHYKNSNHYVTKAWNVINDCRKVVFVVDANRTLTDEVRECLKRLRQIEYNEPEQDFMQMLGQKDFQDKSEDQFIKELENFQATVLDSKNPKNLQKSIPKILVINKMDMCTNRQKLTMQISELQDLGKFDQTFFVSSKTNFGIQSLKQYLEEEAMDSEWQFNPEANSENSIVDQLEQHMKQAIFSRFYHEVPYQIGVVLTEFIKRSDGVNIVTFDLDVDSKIQIALLAGYKGRNKNILIDLVTAELMKLYNKEFEVKIRIKTRKSNIGDANRVAKVIKHPKQGQEEVEKQIDTFNKSREQMAVKIRQYLNIME